MKYFNSKTLTILLSLCLLISLNACDEDDDTAEPTPTNQNNNNSNNGNNGGNNGGGSNPTSISKNTLKFVGDSATLTEFTVSRQLTWGGGNTVYKIDVWKNLRSSPSDDFWIVGLTELPTTSKTYTSSGSVNWQNLAAGEFYFSRADDGGGNSWFYIDSQNITLDTQVSGDTITLTCSNIPVANNIVPPNADSTTTVSVSATMLISEIQNGAENTPIPLVN
jgi:hypothetical protein